MDPPLFPPSGDDRAGPHTRLRWWAALGGLMLSGGCPAPLEREFPISRAESRRQVAVAKEILSEYCRMKLSCDPEVFEDPEVEGLASEACVDIHMGTVGGVLAVRRVDDFSSCSGVPSDWSPWLARRNNRPGYDGPILVEWDPAAETCLHRTFDSCEDWVDTYSRCKLLRLEPCDDR